MQIDAAEAIGLIAGFVGSLAYVPQAIKIIRTRDVSAISALTYTMILTGASLWETYGVLRGSPSIMLWNAVAGSLALLVLVLKLRGAARTS